MKKNCEKCGNEYIPTPSPFGTRQKYCDKCSAKAGIKTQQELARLAHRSFSDKVQADTDEADLEGVSYGVYMARKGRDQCGKD